MPKSKYKKIVKKASGVVGPSANWVTRLMKKVKAQLAKEKTKDTVRTKSITKSLKTAGLTDAQIRKLRGKK